MKTVFLNRSARLSLAIAATCSLSAVHASDNQDSPLSSFNPAMSVIFDGLYYHDTVDGEGMELLEEADSAFHSHGGHDHEGHGHESLKRGFNLRETEITMSGSVDSYFDAWLSVALSGSEIEIEEAWVRSQSLPHGLQVKAGRFLSAIGYHNEHHVHSWQFADQNLAYLSTFGDHGLSGDGVQLTWLAPTDSYLQLGLEILQGDNLSSVGSVIDGDEVVEEINEELGSTFEEDDLNLSDANGPQLGVFTARYAPDLGTEKALQLGVSAALHQDSQSFHEEAGPEFFVSEGDTNIYGVQAVYKHFPTGKYGKGGWSLSGEYFYAESDQKAVFHTDPAELGLNIDSEQGAAYVAATYGFAPRWEIGLRTAASGIGGEFSEGDETEEVRLSRQHSAAVTWYATEFSKLRLQVNRNDVNGEDGSEAFNQIMLQYNLSLGAHGAHSF